MRKVALKGLWLRRGRALLTALAVVLGVAMVCGTYVLTDTISKAFDDIFETGNRNTSAVIAGKEVVEGSFSGSATIPEALLDKVRDLDGVADVAGTVEAEGFGTDQIKLTGPDGKRIGGGNAPSLGVGAEFDETALNPFRLAAGRWPTGDRELVLDQGSADKENLEPGDRIAVSGQGEQEPFTLVGVARYGEVSSLGGATIALFAVPVAQRLLGQEGRLSRIAVQAEPGVGDAQLVETLEPVVGDDAEVRTGAQDAREQSEDIDEATSIIRYVLLAFGLIALGVGAFVIYNTLTITVAQRVRELATLRALGASAKQVRRSVLVEGVVLGLLASVAGLLLGLLLARGLTELFAAIGADLPSTDQVLKTRTIIISLLVGVLVTAVASIAPARRATQISPVAAMQEGARLQPKLTVRRPVIGLTVLALAVAAMLVGAFGGLETLAAVLCVAGGGIGLLVAASMLANRAIVPLVRVLGRPMGMLARRNAMRNPARTASTAGALMIALALVTLVATLGEGLRTSNRDALESVVSAKNVITSDNGFDTIPRAVGEAAAEAPGAEVFPVRLERANVFDDDVSVNGIGDGADSVIGARSEGGSIVPPPGSAVVERGFARDNGLELGDELRLTAPDGREHTFTVSAFQVRTSVQKIDPVLGRVALNLRDFDAAFPRSGDAYVFVGGTATVQALRDALEAFPDVTAQSRADWVDERVAGVNELLALLYVLLALSIIVSLFGMINTLVLTVFERTREIGMLRAVGMSRRQVRRMVRQESVITSLIGAALGLPLGLLVAAGLAQALEPEGIVFAVPVGSLVAFTIVAVVAGILAAIAPARRAGRLDVLKALQFE